MSRKHFPTTTPRRALALAGFLLLAATLPAQRFQYDYGTPGGLSPPEIGTVIVPVGKAGYAIAGSRAGTEMFGLGIQPDGSFNVDGCYSAFDSTTFTPTCGRRTSKNDYIVAGEVVGSTGNMEVMLGWFTAAGLNKFPNRFFTYPGTATGIRLGTRVVETPTGFAVSANLGTGQAGQGVLFATTAFPNLSWWKSYAYGGQPIRFHDLCQADDNGLVVAGTLEDPTAGRTTLILRTTAGGIPIWAVRYLGIVDVEQQAIVALGGERYAVWGHFGPGSPVAGSFVLIVNGAGIPQCAWRFPTILGSRPTIAQTANGDLLCNGRVGDDALILRLAADCSVKAARTYGGVGSVDELFQVQPTSDGGYVAVGSTQLVDTAASDVYVVKADADGDSCCNWQGLEVVRTALPWTLEHKFLQVTDDARQGYVYHRPPVHCLEPTQLCFQSSCVEAPPALNVWLPFDETAGPSAFNVLSLLGMPNGTHVNGPTPVAGKIAGALSFDGLNDRVTVPHHPAADIGTEDLTMDAWIRMPILTNGIHVIADKRVGVGLGNPNNWGYSFFVRGTNGSAQLGVQLADGTHANYVSPVVPIADGQWHFVAVRVKRNSTSHFYVDGTAYAFTPGHPGSLSNSQQLTIGHNSSGYNPNAFQGDIDEFELFRRALSLTELRDIWRADAMGKCKEACFLPVETGLCLNQNSATVPFWICNATTTSHTYTLWFQGLPSGDGCAVHGPTAFAPASPRTETVGPGECKLFHVTVQRPAGMTAVNLAGCFELMGVSDSGEIFTCRSRLRDRRDLCVTGTGWDHTVALLRHDVTRSLGPVRVTNTTAATIQLAYRFRAVDGHGEDDASMLSLDGQAPGAMPSGQAVIPAGGFVDLQVSATFVEFGGLDTYTVLLEADTDGNGEFDYLGGSLLQCDYDEGAPPIYTGVAARTSQGMPMLFVNRNPSVGDASFVVTGTNLAPSSFAFVQIGPALSPFPFPLAIIGGQPSSFAYLDQASQFTLTVTTDPAGSFSLPVPIPADPSLSGAVLHWQVFSIDPSLPFALPIGNSAAMSTTIR